MSILDSGVMLGVRTLAAALLDLGQARLKLASTELEDEWLHWIEMLLLGAVTLFLLGVGVIMTLLLVVLLAWNGPREAVLGAICAFFLGGGMLTIATMRRKARNKPPLLSATLAELQRDGAALRPPAQ